MNRLLAITAIALLADQCSKWGVVYGLDLESRLALDVFPPFLQFRMAWNEGINFGLFANGSEVMRWVLVAVSVLAAVVVLVWARRIRGWLGPLLVGALLGGILGNGFDRIRHGAVADFLNVSCCGIHNPFSFNLADVFIFVGAFGLIAFGNRLNRDRGRP